MRLFSKKKSMSVSQELKDFFRNNNLGWYLERGEHSGCWDRGCSHPVEELHVYKEPNKNIGWSFEEGCSDEMIINILLDRLSAKPN
jgi:hypothetical protein